ncbi:MAG TPA: DUF4252 domain-containing protein [Candidatus Angelobacter sp.]|nr:DUF4252 domain-containing protein [Candidatus Angelobacter sp.]
MNRATRTLRFFALLILYCIAARGFSQNAKLQLDILNKLGEKAARSTDITLDGSMLNFIASVIEKLDDEGDQDVAQLKSIIKGLKGIYIKSFEFDAPGQYSKEDVEAVRSQLGSRWTRIVQSIDKRNHEHDEIYLMKNGDKVAGVVILVAEAREFSVVNIVGDVPIEKISALERHIAANDDDSHRKKPKKGSGHDEE